MDTNLNQPSSKLMLVLGLALRAMGTVLLSDYGMSLNQDSCTNETQIGFAKANVPISVIIFIITTLALLYFRYSQNNSLRGSGGVALLNALWLITCIFFYSLSPIEENQCGQMLNFKVVCIAVPLLFAFDTGIAFLTSLLFSTRVLSVKGNLLWSVIGLRNAFSCGNFDNYMGFVGLMQILITAVVIPFQLLKDKFTNKGKIWNTMMLAVVVTQGLLWLIAVLMNMWSSQTRGTECESKYAGFRTYVRVGVADAVQAVITLIFNREVQEKQTETLVQE